MSQGMRQRVSKTAGRILLCVSGLVGCAVHAQENAEERLRSGLTALAQGQNEQAAKLLGGLVAEQPQAECVARAMCGAGQALVRLGRHQEALEFFEGAIAKRDTSLRPLTLHVAASLAAVSAGLPLKAIEHCEMALALPEASSVHATLYPMLVKSLQAANRTPEAWERLQEVAGFGQVNEHDLAELALSLGLAAVTANEHAVATAALRWYLDHSTHVQNSPHAAEGLAWAKALTLSDPVSAAEALEKFVDQYPQSESAAQALVAAAAFRVQAKQTSVAAANLERLQRDYPKKTWRADQWGAIAETATAAGLNELAAEARKARFEGGNLSSSQSRLAAEALLDAARRNDQALWTAALGVLSQSDDPMSVTRALKGIAEAELVPSLDAAIQELIHEVDSKHSAQATRAACEFLAATQRWSLLATQAERLNLQQADPVTARWIAEALHRQGQSKKAYAWTQVALADPGLSKDIEFMLRVAELAVQWDSLEQTNTVVDALIEQLKAPGEKARLDLIRAEMEIRQASQDSLRFDAARKILESVARNPELDGALSARADWLIGETFFMQGRMEEAINAYRQVETHPGCQLYRPLALVQAGKCFERLGRWREAAQCYSGAVTQPDDRQSARVAQERLQAIQESAKRLR